ncbi:MAG: hypothetical protein GIKADHBN_02743 [Phycisphaerales bacterium]|nr:hypothetical protein [Phycisphaerales bacterium]
MEGSARRRGFTLVEMLVVVGIILTVVTLLLPAVVTARRSSQVAVGAAQLKSLNDLLMNRAMDRKGKLLNISDITESGSSETSQLQFGYYRKSRFAGEGFAAYWCSTLAEAEHGTGLKADMAFSPADGEFRAAYARLDGRGGLFYPSSFFYSPTMFCDWKEYDFTHRDGGCCPSEYGPMYRGDCCDPRTCEKVPCGTGMAMMEQITFPDAKVVLFERADFMQTSRSQINSGGKAISRPLSPAWNNPRARPHVATADGAVSTIDIMALTQAAAQSAKDDPQIGVVPVDLFEAPDSFPVVEGPASSFALDLPDGDGLFPYFFAGTRYGVRGRDLTPESRK